METLPLPFGIVKSVSSNGKNAIVSVSGTVQISEDGIQTGKQYFGTTTGVVVESDMFFGVASAASEAITFIYLKSRKMIISLDSVIGFGLSNNFILLNSKQ
jgi:hypothetical protein